MNYWQSCDLAKSLGFAEVHDPCAYFETAYVRNGLLWIFDIKALMRKLGAVSPDQLRAIGYDVDTYFGVNNQKYDEGADCGREPYFDFEVA